MRWRAHDPARRGPAGTTLRSQELCVPLDSPGGRVEVGEPPERALHREMHEELGITLIAWSLHSLHADGPIHLHLYEIRGWRGDPTAPWRRAFDPRMAQACRRRSASRPGASEACKRIGVVERQGRQARGIGYLDVGAGIAARAHMPSGGTSREAGAGRRFTRDRGERTRECGQRSRQNSSMCLSQLSRRLLCSGFPCLGAIRRRRLPSRLLERSGPHAAA